MHFFCTLKHLLLKPLEANSATLLARERKIFSSPSLFVSAAVDGDLLAASSVHRIKLGTMRQQAKRRQRAFIAAVITMSDRSSGKGGTDCASADA